MWGALGRGRGSGANPATTEARIRRWGVVAVGLGRKGREEEEGGASGQSTGDRHEQWENVEASAISTSEWWKAGADPVERGPDPSK